jgi:hypothetical protein
MCRPPENLCRLCRAATSREVHSWSFGAVSKVRPVAPAAWPEMRGTLDDERAFGRTVDYECNCGKYAGKRYANMICDVCGVKITSRQARRTRFGHINLSVPITHDVCGGTSQIDAFPVLPAAIRESIRGMGLNDVYEKMLHASNNRDATSMQQVYHELCAVLGPAVTVAVEWMLQDADVLARGLGLVLVAEDDPADSPWRR